MTERMVSGCMSIMTCRLAEFNRPQSQLHNQPSDIHWKDARKPAARLAAEIRSGGKQPEVGYYCVALSKLSPGASGAHSRGLRFVVVASA